MVTLKCEAPLRQRSFSYTQVCWGETVSQHEVHWGRTPTRVEAALTQMSSHTRDITQLEWTERAELAARLERSFKGEIWSSFSLPKYVAGTTLQFSDVFREVCSNATILSVLASQPRGKLWIKPREGLNWGGSTQEEGGKRRTPKDCDRSFKRPQRSQEQQQPCLPYQFLQRCWAEFPTISSKVTFHWIHLQF